MVILLSRVVIDPVVRALCCHPYPGHPRGCPNYNRKPGCPPGAPMFDDRMDLGRPVYAIINEFDLAAHMERMRQDHPDWSERQLTCCLYDYIGDKKWAVVGYNAGPSAGKNRRMPSSGRTAWYAARVMQDFEMMREAAG